MNEKIVEMVKLAIENGAVSQKHRNLILNKAKEVGRGSGIWSDLP